MIDFYLLLFRVLIFEYLYIVIYERKIDEIYGYNFKRVCEVSKS
jgi:hypothetical protein